jgi:glycosyltransferase involved in cell wall biosynthesis
MMPEVSVIIPTRSRWAMLSRAALPTALAQRDVDLEVVVVDDGSTDETQVQLAGVTDRRVRVVRRERSGGMAVARNAGIEVAGGEWIAFLDDDDLWAPRKLRTQIDAARADGAGFAYAAVIAVDEQGRALADLFLPTADELASKLLRACVVPAGASNVIVRADVLRELGGFDERFAHVADWDLWLRLVDRVRGVACSEVLVAYVLHDANMHVVDKSSRELGELIRKHAAATPPRIVAPDLASYARWEAAQRSRAGLNVSAARVYVRSALTHRSPGNILRAVDALLGKRVSAAARRIRSDGAPTAREAPEWARRDAA